MKQDMFQLVIVGTDAWWRRNNGNSGVSNLLGLAQRPPVRDPLELPAMGLGFSWTGTIEGIPR